MDACRAAERLAAGLPCDIAVLKINEAVVVCVLFFAFACHPSPRKRPVCTPSTRPRAHAGLRRDGESRDMPHQAVDGLNLKRLRS